jgi:flavin reductase (DIM6/NTAB) family NADH-FMN oxidoreductase RutF
MSTRQQRFRTLMGRFATGVTVVAARQGDGVGAMTASAVTAVSLEPLMLLVCFRNESRLLPSLLQAGAFSVNVLSAAQAGVSRYYAGQANGECPARWRLELAEAPVLDGAIATFACRVASTQRAGDHTVVYGAVDDMIAADRAAAALVYAGGRYHDLALSA